MANTTYPKGAQKILSGSINFTSDTIKAALVSSTYTYSAGHEFLSDLGTTVGTAQTLSTKSVTGGVFDAGDLDFGALAPGDTVKALALVKDTGNPSTSPLLLYLDSGPSVGLPFNTNGGGVTVPWNGDAKKIFRLKSPVYPKAGQLILSGGLNLLTADIRAVALPSSYTHNDSHEFLVDVGTFVGSPVALSGKTVTGGVFDANDINLGSLAGGSTLGSVLLYVHTGDSATARLVAHLTDITGFPLATSGTDVSVRWSNGASKIFDILP